MTDELRAEVPAEVREALRLAEEALLSCDRYWSGGRAPWLVRYEIDRALAAIRALADAPTKRSKS